VFAGYAVVVAIVTQGPSRVWGVWAAPGYALAALAAWRSHRSELPLLIGDRPVTPRRRRSASH
jgi:hypothetical protein